MLLVLILWSERVCCVLMGILPWECLHHVCGFESSPCIKVFSFIYRRVWGCSCVRVSTFVGIKGMYWNTLIRLLNFVYQNDKGSLQLFQGADVLFIFQNHASKQINLTWYACFIAIQVSYSFVWSVLENWRQSDNRQATWSSASLLYFLFFVA